MHRKAVYQFYKREKYGHLGKHVRVEIASYGIEGISPYRGTNIVEVASFFKVCSELVGREGR